MKKILAGLALVASLSLVQAAPRAGEDTVASVTKKECKLKKRGLECPCKDLAECNENCIEAVRSMDLECKDEEKACEEMKKEAVCANATEEKKACDMKEKDACEAQTVTFDSN